MLNVTGRKILHLLVGAVVFGLAFFASYSGAVAVPKVSVEWKAPGMDRYTPSYNAEPGREWAFVYVGSSGCAASNDSFLPSAVKKLKRLVQEQARTHGYAFATVGVAKDWRVADGIAHLEKFGPFDEITAGRNWLNLGVLRYVWEKIPGKAGTPQVLVVSRNVVTSEEQGSYALRTPKLLTRKVGTREIRRWLKQAAPLPRLEPATKNSRYSLPR